MVDIKSHQLLWLKFGLFCLVGLLAVASALVLYPSILLAMLIGVAIWAFCRAYYFAFYVIEHYVDPSYRFAGLGSFVLYAMGRDDDTRKSG
jgi:hypothetical protein